MAKYLNLGPEETSYFETLVNLGRAKTAKEKNFHYEKLNLLRPKRKTKIKDYENFKYLANPIHTMILEMSSLKDFSQDPKWIQSRLENRYKLSEIKDALGRLFELNLIKSEDGRITKTSKHLISQPDIVDEGGREYLRKIIKISLDSLDRQQLNEREFLSYSFPIKKDQLPKAKEMIRDFAIEFMETMESPPQEGDEVYQINTQFFRITK